MATSPGLKTRHSGAIPPVKPGEAHLLAQDSRFDRRRSEILRYATEVFCEKGYAAASMRDLARSSGMSLAGLYHYFESKEKLLFLIQKQTFSTIVGRLRERLSRSSDPEQRIRIFIQNHLEYFLANQKAMKVLSHEDDVLQDEYGAEVAALKREYYKLCVGLIQEFIHLKGLEWNSAKVRIAVLSLFGMMNWIYTWHNPRMDAAALIQQMGDIFLMGIAQGSSPQRRADKQKTTKIVKARRAKAARIQ